MASVHKSPLLPKKIQSASTSLNQKQKRDEDTLPKLAQSTLQRSPTTMRAATFRFNKLYRGPPTPPPGIQLDRERSFVLDCQAVSHISTDKKTDNPKLGSVIPPYNAQLDSTVDNYFNFYNVPQILERTGQVYNEKKNCSLNFAT